MRAPRSSTEGARSLGTDQSGHPRSGYARRVRELDDLIWPIHTARLTLRRAAPEDARTAFAYRSRHGVAQWLSQIQTDPEAWAREWLGRMPTTIIPELDGRLIGDLRLVVVDAHSQKEVAVQAAGREAELMWAFDPAWHGHGYATEAVQALITVAFGQLGLRRVIAICYADNAPSWRLMERVGMRREGHSVQSTLHRDGTWRDFLTYTRLASD